MLAVRIFLIPALIGIGPIILALIWMLKDQKDKIRAQLVIALILNFFYGLLLEIFMGHEGSLLPWKYDNILLHIDASLGIRAIAVAGHLPGFLHEPLWIIYEMMLPMMIAWIFVASHSRFSGSIILAYVAELVTAPLIYTILPPRTLPRSTARLLSSQIRGEAADTAIPERTILPVAAPA